jgi:hypothetical protein
MRNSRSPDTFLGKEDAAQGDGHEAHSPSEGQSFGNVAKVRRAALAC